MNIAELIIALIMLPLAGAFINGVFGKSLSKSLSGIIGTMAIAGSFILALFLFNHIENPHIITLFRLVDVGSVQINVNFLVDHLSIWMTLIITGIGTLIHLFSMGYMKEDGGYYKFFTYLNLFIFAMLLLVLGGNYFVLFFGWEGVGICSFLLIGFHYNDQQKGIANGLAARKAFVMNRIGDVGLILAMFMLLNQFGTLDFHAINTTVSGNIAQNTIDHPALIVLTLSLFLAATGKSAQIPLFTWLPDAMAGPTPVSALIHAATMVTAGIYLVVRSNFLFELVPFTQEILLYIGLATSLVAAFMALRQNDIKKVLAYSTVSQLGLMVVALGLGAYTAAIFHVTTHAFFKALLFLGSGSVIHGLHHEQDIRKMGGLRKIMPITHFTFLIGTLAISGIPLLSGFFSKDEIIGHLYEHNVALYFLLMISVLMTAIYMFRLYFLTFHGSFRGDEHTLKHAHESPLNMTLPLIILAVLSVVGGVINLPGLYLHDSAHWLNEYLSKVPGLDVLPHHAPEQGITLLLMGIASVMSIGTLVWAYRNYVQKGNLAKQDENLSGWERLSNRKLFWDEVYATVFVQPVLWISRQLNHIIEIRGLRAGVFALARGISNLGQPLARLQNGLVSSYLFWMVLGLILLFGINLLNTL